MNGTSIKPGGKCRCCPYGFHIHLDFVSYAEDVNSGFNTRNQTPVGYRSDIGHHERVMSPMESIFSNSFENIMSDFEDALGHREVPKPKPIPPRNGYQSDYTGYHSKSLEKPIRSNFEAARISRPTTLTNSAFGSRSSTPQNGKPSNGYSTSLAKTVSEIRARNSESPFPREEPNSFSRVGTPIDLGLHQVPQGHQSNGATSFYNNNYQCPPTPTRKFRNEESLPPTPTPTFNRTPSQGDLKANSFASLRRGREYALSDNETSRSRYFSTSPKLNRRLHVAPIIDEPQFTYTQNNGHTMLAKTQSTSMSPRSEEEPKKSITHDVAVSTGPLPPAKPCSECPDLKERLQDALDRLPPPRPDTVTSSTSTDLKEHKEIAVGNHVSTLSIAISTEYKELKDTSTDPIEELQIDTSTKTTVDACNSPIQIPTRDMYSQSCYPPKLCHFGTDTDDLAGNEPPKDYQMASYSDAFSQTEEKSISETENSLAPCEVCSSKKDTFTRNVGVGACSVSDKICISCDKGVEEVDENEAPGFQADEDKKKEFEAAKNSAIKKLLTTDQNKNFSRNSAVSRSLRIERRKSTDDLEYIEQKVKAPSAPATTPMTDTSDALTGKVALKKEQTPPVSKLPEPIAAKIPRPKFVKYASPEETAENEEEIAEASDRLTPLRSELRSLSRWQRCSSPVLENYPVRQEEEDSDTDSIASDGTFEPIDEIEEGSPFEISKPLTEALESLNSHLLMPETISAETADWALKYVQHEWMKTAARKKSRFDHVDKFIEVLQNLGPVMLKTVVNLTDQNVNSALHYAVSHGNFSVVSSLLDSGECLLNTPNKVGYTAVMLAALSSLEDDIEKAVVQRIFEMGDVNAKAAQHGQTALMLAVSHNKKATSELLMACGADVNAQDEEGSTALMCAAEHGHRDLVKMLLSTPGIDSTLTDCDSSTALSIAVENGHKDIAVLIYAHQNYSKLNSLETSNI